MTKEYLKMADVINGDVTHICNDLLDGNGNLLDSICLAYAAHAINSHDELVAEVERLRQIISALLRTTESISCIDKKSGGWGSGYVDCANDISKALKEMVPLA